jgi:hypothetical protein
MSSLAVVAPDFLKDLCVLIKEKAIGAKRNLNGVMPGDRDHAIGRLMAYHEVVSLIQQQAVAFDIDMTELNMADIDPERDLL